MALADLTAAQRTLLQLLGTDRGGKAVSSLSGTQKTTANALITLGLVQPIKGLGGEDRYEPTPLGFQWLGK